MRRNDLVYDTPNPGKGEAQSISGYLKSAGGAKTACCKRKTIRVPDGNLIMDIHSSYGGQQRSQCTGADKPVAKQVCRGACYDKGMIVLVRNADTEVIVTVRDFC